MADVAPKSLFGRGGETREGAIVYRELDPLSKKTEKMILHLLRAITPSIVPIDIPIGAELDPSAAKSIKLSRFARGVVSPGEKDPLTGRSFTRSGELFRAFTGLQSETIDMEKQLKFKSVEFKENRSEAASIFNQIKKVEDPTYDQFISQWIKADNARLKTFRKFKLMIDDLITLGMNPREIKTLLRKQHKVGRAEVNSIFKDRYEPFQPSEDTIKFFKKRGVPYPKRLIKDLQMQREDIPLSKFIEPELQTFEDDQTSMLPPGEDSTPTPLFSTPTNVSETTPTNVSPIAGLPPSDPLFGESATRQIASFLGSDPESVLKNLQIAQRNPRA